MKLSPLTTVLAVLMTTSVVLNGAHAKDLIALPLFVADTNPAVPVKVGLDLHPHVDKHFGKFMPDNPQIDNRSLRLRAPKKPTLSVVRGWLTSWRDQLALYLD